MTNSLQMKKQNHQENHEIENLSKAAWSKIAPFWPR